MKFSKNWNKKIDCDYFTTIRRYTKLKYDYYFKKLNKIDDIWVNKVIYKSAKLVGIQVMELFKVDKTLLILDTGSLNYNDIFEKFKFKPNDKVMILLYQS